MIRHDTSALTNPVARSTVPADLASAGWWSAFEQWLVQLGRSPAKPGERILRSIDMGRRLTRFVQKAGQPSNARRIEPLPTDHRFEQPGWQLWPFDAISQSYLLTQNWGQHATTGHHDVLEASEPSVAPAAREWLDIIGPDRLGWITLPIRSDTVDARQRPGQVAGGRA